MSQPQPIKQFDQLQAQSTFPQLYHSSLSNSSSQASLTPSNHPIFFKYCFEIDRVARREDSHTIQIAPSYTNPQGISIFKREAVLGGLEKDCIDRFEIQSVKYYDQDLRSWVELPEELKVDVSSQSLDRGGAHSFVELLLREMPKEHQKRNSFAIQNPWLREPTKLQDLEREILSLKEKVSTLEEQVHQHGEFLDTQKMYQPQNRPLRLSKGGSQNQSIIMHSGHNNNEQLAAKLDQLQMQSDDTMMQEEQLPQIPQLGKKKSSHQKFICHQCHSDILIEKKHPSFNALGQSKLNFSRQSSANDTSGLINELSTKRIRQYTSDSMSSSNQIHTKNTGYQGAGFDDDSYSSHDMDNDSNSQDQDFGFGNKLNSAEILNKQKQSRNFDDNTSFFEQHPPSHNANKRKLDLAYLYADPLVYKSNDRLLPVSQPLDTENEIREIQRFISQEKKGFVIRKEAANFESLKQVLSKSPKIIHISCHGDYDEETKQFYLAFEEKDSGILDKLTEKRLLKLLGEENSQHKVHLVFVSACHSEMIGKIFQKAKIPVVVAVNQHTLILDQVCQLFSRHFYNFLIDGHSSKYAFEEAQKVVQGSNIEKYSCCCAHDHKPSCSWQKFALAHGYERAHEIHTPNCICNMDQNLHKQNCKFAKNFTAELMQYDDPFDLDADNFEGGFDKHGNIRVCCCQPNLPHDESIKFILNGTEEAKDMVIFKRRQEGEVVIENDVNKFNKLPQIIDNQMLIGRNKELQEIVKILFSNDLSKRLIHIYGGEGVGKSAIAKYAAKYTLERRKFNDGAYHIEIENRNSGQGIVSKICQKLHIQNCSKEQLCDIIKSNDILIIIDKCKKILEEGKNSFNKTLRFLIENTTYTKIMVVTRQKEDISSEYSFKVPVEIGDLTKLNAAKLLLMVAGQYIHLKNYKNPKELQKHQIFDLISFKPSGILQLASLIQEKSLDEIATQIQQEKKIEADSQTGDMLQSQIQFQHEFGEFSCILNISYRDLKSKFSLELNLLYLLCQASAGLCESDVEWICFEKPHLYGEWKKFLKDISESDNQQVPNILEKKDSKKEKSLSKIKKLGDKTISETEKGSSKKKGFRMVTYYFSEELQENHYLPQPIVSEYINSLVLSYDKKVNSFQECFRYLAKLSRRLVRSIKVQKKREIDLHILSSEIDFGIWSDTMSSQIMTPKELETQMVYNAEARFNQSEGNFQGMLDLEVMKNHFTKLDYNNVYSQYLDELCINIPSIFLMLQRYDEAVSLIDKCKKICSEYNLKFTKAKLLMMQASIIIKKSLKDYELQKYINDSDRILMNLDINEGVAECFFLKAINLIVNFQGAKNERKDYYDSGFSNYGNMGSELRQSNISFSSILSSSGVKHKLDRFNSDQVLSAHPQMIGKQMSYQTHSMNSNLNQNNNQQKVQTQIENILVELRKARKFFKTVNSEFGLAKVNLIEAEFYIEFIFESGFHPDYEPKNIAKTVNTMISDALFIFKKIGLEFLVARCLRNIAILNSQNNDPFEAKRHIEEALIILKRLDDQEQVASCTGILNRILHQIRINSNNVFLFVKAFPLVRVNGDGGQTSHVGTFTRYSSDFRKRLLESFKKQQKVINLKFDILCKEMLEYVRTYGCRVLHLSSDVYISDQLCIEGDNGEIEYISLKQLKTMLKPKEGKLNVDVVVVAIPESVKIAELFNDLGVPHVIAFDFKQKLINTFVDNVYTRPKRYDYIYDFCVEFYKNLIQEKTVYEAWKEAKPRINDKLRKLNDKIGNVALTKEDVGQGPLLFPVNVQLHKIKLFDSTQFEDHYLLKHGQYMDSSKVRGPSNVIKKNTPYTGRQIEMHQVLIALLNKERTKIVNVHGLEGIGKTRFVQEVAYYLSARYRYKDGIFMFDVKRVKTIDQLKHKLKDINMGGQLVDLNSNLSQKDILLIFDDIDSVLKNNKTQFDWWLLSLLQLCEKLKIIIITKKEISYKNQSNLQKQIFHQKLKPLNDIEAVDMILSYCPRQITKDELSMSNESSMSIHHQLQQEGSVKKCYGFPKYLEIFANYLELHSFDKIDIKNYIPTDKRGQMKRLQKEDTHFSKKRNTVKVPKHEYGENTMIQSSGYQESQNTFTFDVPNSLPLKPHTSYEEKKIKQRDKKYDSKVYSQQFQSCIKEEDDEDGTEQSSYSKNYIPTRKRINQGYQIKTSIKNLEEEKNENPQQDEKMDDECQNDEEDEDYFKLRTQSYQDRRASTLKDKHNNFDASGDEMDGAPGVFQITKSKIGETKISKINSHYSIGREQNHEFQTIRNRPSVKKLINSGMANMMDSQYIENPGKGINFEMLESLGQSQFDKLQLIDGDNNDGELVDVQLVFPLMKAESQMSQMWEPPATGRSRSSSGLDHSQYRSRGKQDNNETQLSNDQFWNQEQLKLSIHGHSTSKPKKHSQRSKILEKQDEEDQLTDSKKMSEFEEDLNKGGNFDLGDLKTNKFDLNQLSCESSESYQEDGDDAFGMLAQEAQTQKALHKQTSMFTSSSGGRSDLSKGSQSMSLRSSKGSIGNSAMGKKEDKVLKLKKEAREEFGPRSGRQGAKFKSKTKNKNRELKDEKQFEKKKTRKDQVKKKKTGISYKMEFEGGLIEEQEDEGVENDFQMGSNEKTTKKTRRKQNDDNENEEEEE